MELSARCREALAQFFESQAKAKAMGVDPTEARVAAVKTLEKMRETPRFMDKVGEYYTNALISGVATPVVNAFSIMRMFGDIPMKFIEGGINDAQRAIGRNVDVMKPGLSEAVAFAKGSFSPWTSIKALQEILEFGKRGFLEGTPLDAPTDYVNKAIGMGRILPDGTTVESSKAEKIAGEVVRTPTRVAVGIDELMKAYYRRVKVYELVNKVQNRFTDEMLQKRGTTREQLLSVLQDAIDNPGKNSKWQHTLMTTAPDLYEDVVKFAKKQTFQEDPPEFIKTLMKAKGNHPMLSFFIPFIRTPYNITQQAAEHIPGIGIATKLFKKNEGGRGRHLSADVFTDAEALAKQSFGLASTYLLYKGFENGTLTAGYPKDAAERQKMIDAGIPEYGMKVGDTWVDWGRVEPFATVAIGIGTFQQEMKQFEEDRKKTGKDRPEVAERMKELGESTAMAMSKALVQRQFLYGLSTALNAIVAPEGQGMQYVKQSVGNVAAPALLAGAARAFDPYQRKTETVMDAVQNRIPGWRNQLPIDYKTFGGPRENPQYGIAAALPAVENLGKQTPLQEFAQEVGFKKAPLSKTIEGIKLDPREYEQYARISNEEVTKTLEARLPALEANQSMSMERKKYLMEKWTDDARKRAKQIFLRELSQERPTIRKEIADQKRRNQGLPVQ